MTRRSIFRRALVFAVLSGACALAQESQSWEQNVLQGSQAIREGRYADARRLLLAAFEQSKAFPPNDIRRGQTQHALGSAYQMQGDIQRAEGLYLQARAVFEAIGAPARSNLASTLDILGQLRFEQGSWGEAEGLLKKSLALYSELDGDNDPHTMIPSRHLGELYTTMGRRAEALPLLNKAAQVFRQSGITNALSATLVSLGHLHLLEGRYGPAEAAFKEAVQLSTTLGEDHPALADSLVNLASLYRVKRESDRAEPLLRRAAAIYRKADDPHLAGPLSELGHIALANRKYATAQKYFEEARAIVTKMFGAEHITIAVLLVPIAETCLALHQYEKADTLVRQAIPKLHELFGQASFEEAKALLIAAQIEEKQSRDSEAYSDYRQALNLYGKAIGPTHPEAVHAQQLYSRFVKKFGK